MKQILLVEDTAHLAEEIADILKMEGYAVKVAGNAMAALEHLSHSRPDLIITDLLMPVMDGYELILKVRSMALFKDIPIIILSAKTAPEDKQRGKEVGANTFIHKPCQAETLVETVSSFFEVSDNT